VVAASLDAAGVLAAGLSDWDPPRVTDHAEYRLQRPHPALAGLVVRYAGFREFSPAALTRRQAPTGACTMVVGFGPPLALRNRVGACTSVSFVAGLHDGPVHTTFTGWQHGVQVDLTPLGMFCLIGRPAADLTNQVLALHDLGPTRSAALPERLADDASWAVRFARLDAVLLAALDAARTRVDPEVTWAWARLARSAGTVTVQDLADGTGWSRRRLLTRFHQQVGMAPKAVARVLRFHRAAGLLVPQPVGGRSRRVRSLADVASCCGYADHAHLTREFRALAGCTPTTYIAEWAQARPPIPSSVEPPGPPTVRA
jgi:AraC-like DNA-binding protein